MGTQQTQAGRLNPRQRASLSIRLRHLERNLDEIDELLGGDREGLLYRAVTRLSDDRRTAIRETVDLLRTEIPTVAAKFDLEVEEKCGEWAIVAMLSSAWVSLDETWSKKLGRFGPADPALEGELDPHIERIIEHVLLVQKLASNNHEGGHDACLQSKK
jgi:hypothetical protein